jgi:hypothetical protein
MIARGLRNLPAVPRETVWIVAALALACVVAAALAGWGLGRALRSTPTDAAAASRRVTLGHARLQVPSTWTPIKVASAHIPGVDAGSTRAFRIDDGLGRRAFLTFAAPSDQRLIPSSLRRALRPPIGEPAPGLLAGHRAWWYANIATARRHVVMSVTVLPTSAGVLAVACTSSGVADAGNCDQDIEQIALSQARVLRPRRETAFRLAASSVLRRLHDGRAALVRELNAARDAHAQARALLAIGNAYGIAARTLDPFASGPGRASDAVTALRETASAYETAGTAASAQASGSYFVARSAVEAAESRLATVLAQLG